MEPLVSTMNTIPWFGWIAIVALVCSTIQCMAKSKMRHRERIEMIRMGMNPDQQVEKLQYREQEV